LEGNEKLDATPSPSGACPQTNMTFHHRNAKQQPSVLPGCDTRWVAVVRFARGRRKPSDLEHPPGCDTRWVVVVRFARGRRKPSDLERPRCSCPCTHAAPPSLSFGGGGGFRQHRRWRGRRAPPPPPAAAAAGGSMLTGDEDDGGSGLGSGSLSPSFFPNFVRYRRGRPEGGRQARW
jgi:hypothetical protein